MQIPEPAAATYTRVQRSGVSVRRPAGAASGATATWPSAPRPRASSTRYTTTGRRAAFAAASAPVAPAEARVVPSPARAPATTAMTATAAQAATSAAKAARRRPLGALLPMARTEEDRRCGHGDGQPDRECPDGGVDPPHRPQRAEQQRGDEPRDARRGPEQRQAAAAQVVRHDGA